MVCLRAHLNPFLLFRALCLCQLPMSKSSLIAGDDFRLHNIDAQSMTTLICTQATLRNGRFRLRGDGIWLTPFATGSEDDNERATAVIAVKLSQSR
jgi:hypothetical protein